MYIIERQNIDSFFEILKKESYEILGPTLHEEAIIYAPITSTNDLPIGWTDEQRAGHYRLKKRNDEALFGYVPSPNSWKQFLSPPKQKFWNARRNGKNIQIKKIEIKKSKMAFIGIRSCELRAISIQDKVFLQGDYVNEFYQNKREDVLFIAVNCTKPGGTCFCASMDTGPEVKKDFDLCLTEIINKNMHYFLIQAGSLKGEEILKKVKCSEAKPSHREEFIKCMDASRKMMGRQMDTKYIKELLYNNYEHPQWDKVADQCLSCANCTMVCPTCFCSTVEDVTDLTGEHSERWQSWDSCFTQDFSYIHGGHVRKSTKSRYRQWITHKLASWHDQFGTSGCVGCGRCITWCPTGIDITEEVKHIQENSKEGTKKETHHA